MQASGRYGSYSAVGRAMGELPYRGGIANVRVGDLIFYIALSFFIIQGYLETTMYVDLLPASLFSQAKTACLVLVAVKLAIDSIDKRVAALAAGAFVVFVSSLTMLESGYNAPIVLAAFLLGAIGVDFDRIARLYLALTSILFAFTVLSCAFGVIDNVSVPKGSRTLLCYGFTYTTELSAHVTYTALAFYYAFRKRLSWLHTALVVSAAFTTYALTEGRLALALMLLSAAVVAFIDYRKRHGVASAHKPHCGAFVWSYIVVALVSLVLMVVYSDVGFLGFLNNLLTGRLHWAHLGFEQYGLTLFGQEIDMQGWGRGVVLWAEDYFYIDCSYVKILLRFGVVTLIAVLVVATRGARRAFRKRDYYLLAILVLAALAAFVNEHLMDLCYNIFILAGFALLGSSKNDSSSDVLTGGEA